MIVQETETLTIREYLLQRAVEDALLSVDDRHQPTPLETLTRTARSIGTAPTRYLSDLSKMGRTRLTNEFQRRLKEAQANARRLNAATLDRDTPNVPLPDDGELQAIKDAFGADWNDFYLTCPLSFLRKAATLQREDGALEKGRCFSRLKVLRKRAMLRAAPSVFAPVDGVRDEAIRVWLRNLAGKLVMTRDDAVKASLNGIVVYAVSAPYTRHGELKPLTFYHIESPDGLKIAASREDAQILIVNQQRTGR